jgi:hypothetical protein
MRASLTAALVLLGAASSVWLSSCANPDTCGSPSDLACRVVDGFAKGQPILQECGDEASTSGHLVWKPSGCNPLGDGGGPDNCQTRGVFNNVVCASGLCVCR